VVYLIDIILVKSDPIINQSSIRAMQIIKSLRKKYSIIALGWNRGHETCEFTSDHEDSIHLFSVKAPYGFERHGTLRLALYFPIFWIWIFINLCVHRPKSVHACDLATILPCYIYKVLFKRKLIFDVLDRYGMTYVPNDRNGFYKRLHSLINSLEEFFAKNSDVLIAVSDKIFLTFRNKPNNCVTLMNCPEDGLIRKPRLETSVFKLLFTGAIRTGRGLETVIDIVKNMKDTELIVTGKNKDMKLYEKIAGIPNIKYYGFLDRNKLLDLEASSDVMIALYDLNLQSQYEYGMGNKVLEAMMCGLPIITNISHELVNDTKCGLIVEYENVEQLKQAIITLQGNPELRRLLGTNGRKAFLEKYNWTKMEEKLLRTYEALFNDKIALDKR
jgi:glycosyltransferase involved in cell wall biosynthesis